jgi:hypothetical protein
MERTDGNRKREYKRGGSRKDTLSGPEPDRAALRQARRYLQRATARTRDLSGTTFVKPLDTFTQSD